MSGAMNRSQFLRALGLTALSPLMPGDLFASTRSHRRRPSDAAWPSASAWKQLNNAVGGNLMRVTSPLSKGRLPPQNPYYLGDEPGLTETLGWLDAWSSKPSVYAVAARNAHDIAAAVNFARENNLRLVVKGAGHSYLGTSNAPDSLMIWTRHMHDIQMHAAFVPKGCEHVAQPAPAVTVGAGTIGMQAYDLVTTKAGKYVQGGGCTTVGLAGLIQGGGFGSFSKHYGLAAASLLEAEVVTADGAIRISNACSNSDLFWALKGGGGGTFGVISKMTLRLHNLPEFFGACNLKIKASSDDAYHRLIGKFVGFYRMHLFNDHWGEQARIRPDNTLEIAMDYHGLSTEQAKRVWQPFLDWVADAPDAYSLTDRVVIGSIPARHWWDALWWKDHWPEIAFPRTNAFVGLLDYALVHLIPQPAFAFDDRPGASGSKAWWKGSTDEAGQFLWAYESIWLPASLLQNETRLADVLFASSRQFGFSLHFNKGLAGAPAAALEAAKDTATNPAVLTAFALVIAADGEGPAYPGIPGHEPSATAGRNARARIARCMNTLRSVVPNAGSYFNETNYFEQNWQQSFWGANHARLAAIKQKYDPDGLFYVHHGVGSEHWSADGFTHA
jgi:FAD/FMN-containing dehydrogenase